MKQKVPKGKKIAAAPYALSVEQALSAYGSDAQAGLSVKEARNRFTEYGYNDLSERAAPSLAWRMLMHATNPLVLVLIVTTIIMSFLGRWLDVIVVSIVVLLDIVLATLYERHARGVIAALKRYFVDTVQVIREGKTMLLEPKLLVPGDVIVMRPGDRVPADARLVLAEELACDEAILTGESQPVAKDASVTLPDETPLFSQKNMIFQGTHIQTGIATALVVATGNSTELGKVFGQVTWQKPPLSPLSQQLRRLTNIILRIMALSVLVVFFVSVINRKSLAQILSLSVPVFVSAVPEGLAVILTVALAIGAWRMARAGMVVQNLSTVETLGRTNVIVMDKTGTLTLNEMVVLAVLTGDKRYEVTGHGYDPVGSVFYDDKQISSEGDHEALFLSALAAQLLGQQTVLYRPDEKGSSEVIIKGDPMDGALAVFAQKIPGAQEAAHRYQLLDEIPFEPTVRSRIALFGSDDDVLIFRLGAPEWMVERFVSNEKKVETEEILRSFLKEGLRILAIAYRRISRSDYEQGLESFNLKEIGDLQFLGLYGIQDGIRPKVDKMIKRAHEYGIETVMATGDHPETAAFVARKTGILPPDDDTQKGIMTGAWGDEIPPVADLRKTRVFARMTPQQKVKLVNLFRQEDQLVTMIGDGVNDAPALRAADIGIAMGQKGADLAQKAADMALVGDSFSSFMRAFELSRHLVLSLRRVLLYLVSTNLAEIILVVGVVVVFDQMALLPSHILWLNLVTDSFLDVALVFEPLDEAGLKRPDVAERIKRGVFDRGLFLNMGWRAFAMALIAFLFYVFNIGAEPIVARTRLLLLLAALQWVNAWNCRSETRSVFSLKLLGNLPLIAATGLVMVLQIAVMSVPLLQDVFRVTWLPLQEWVFILLLACSLLGVDVLIKRGKDLENRE